MIAFIGLGNIGNHYANTKHNFGFWVVNELAQRWNLSFRPGKGQFVFSEYRKRNVLLAKPTSGMNRSGVPVKEICSSWRLHLEDLHIIVDDVDLPLGTMRLRPKGGDGCHRGMESIIYQLGANNFSRLRMGIGTDEAMRPAEDYVLKPFRRKDEKLSEEMIRRGADAVESILDRGLEQTMAEFNRMQTKEQ